MSREWASVFVRGWIGIVLLLLSCPFGLRASDDLQKTQKKELEAAAKALIEEAKSFESSGKLVEARLKYAESLGYIELNDAREAVERLNKELHNQSNRLLKNMEEEQILAF